MQAGPVQAPSKSRYSEPPPPRKRDAETEPEDGEDSDAEEDDEDEVLSSIDGDLDDANLDELSGDEEEVEDDESEEEPQLERLLEAVQKPERKRKRKVEEEDLEGKYMQKLADAEEKEEAERQAERRIKRQKLKEAKKDGPEGEDVQQDDEASSGSGSDSEEEEVSVVPMPSDVPLHESLAPDNDASDLEKAARTVFLANVCTSAISSKSAYKILLKHLESFISSLPAPLEGKPAHKVESFRFRSTPYATPQLPKKASFAKKDIRDATTKSTNAYAVYSTAYAAREAVKKLNGTVVLDRHLRVDGVAHPAKTDHKRCVFVGNLGFVDDESMLDANENERKRSKIPSDIEEGLWRQFGKAGTVESVRVVRDEKTRIGKGFAYVQFVDPNSVEAALLFNDKKFPPMLPRILRVVRAKPVKNTTLAQAAVKQNRRQNAKVPDKSNIYNPKVTSEEASLKGRASRLLGKAGASKLKSSGANDTPMGARGIAGIAKTPEKIIFEGHRATMKSGKPNLNGKKGGGKPKTKGAKRAATWKKNGGRN